jgi:hypothetical protein
VVSLILGIIGVLCCAFLGPVALFLGNASRQRIQASGGTLGGGGMATAGFILGIIGSVELVIGVLITVASIINGATHSGG